MSRNVEELLANVEFRVAGVRDPVTGEIQLYDIFVQGKWCGSRRTPEQCQRFIRAVRPPPPVTGE